MTLTQSVFVKTYKLDHRVPVIAILTQPATSFNSLYHDAAHRYSEIVQSYVEYVEQTGALSALVKYDLPWAEMEEV